MAAPKNDLNYPKIVWARAPEGDNGYVRLMVSERQLATLYGAQRYAAMGEYAGLILGEGVLIDPTVIYQGLKRPFHQPGMDENVYAYVSRPDRSFTYRTAGVVSPDKLVRLQAPLESVFIAFVSLTPHMVEQEVVPSPDDREVAGTVLFWEWTMASESDANLPRDADTRYGRKVWPTP